ncbi:ATP-binding protein [Kineosporia sp. J2-2]|uniref:ATP-binding protein n=1 Tax=Kineosporia corallincola TaxID=2835133 RepID=A0ABS5TI28_9ACTN|nr:ATP-binding protein [Kineosporia corallincola]MBT0770749.1 ATP-binding protein [Kineosporia corallincola]
MSDAVGLVVGTEDSTPLKFAVAVGPDAYLQLDDVVVTQRTLPGVGPVMTSGIVTEVRSRHEGASFGSDVFLIADGVLPAQVQEIAEITTTRVDPEVYVPPLPGSQARRAQGDERARALYFDQMDQKVPVGLGRDGLPVFLNLEFLNGVRGAHVSISGISGVATKTSFALWLMHSIFRSGVLGGGGRNSKALVFSVKGEDLLFLDKTNVRLDDRLREEYALLGVPAEPFASVGFFAPPTPQDAAGRPHVTGRTSGVSAFWWTLAEFCADGLLPYVFADVEDERNQYTMVVHNVASRLRFEAEAAGVDGAVTIEGRTVRTYEALVDFVVDKLSDDSTRGTWAGPAIGQGTANAFIRRLISSVRPLREIIRGDLPKSDERVVSTEGQQITVVDLHNLQERGQRFVVGVVLAAETRRKEAAGTGSLLFTMIDELNKYAPREGNSPIKDTLLDIAERGRSLGIILIGAQQTASEVERRIISNSSIKVVGRLDPAEAGRPEYGFLPPSQRQRATLAKPGTMFVTQPEIPVPLAIEFPFPAWATRQSECNAEDLAAPPQSSSAAPRASVFTRLPPTTEDDEPPF